MIEKHKFQKKIATLLVVIVVLLSIPLFFYDIGINSKFHVKHDFNSLFNKRKLGDCDAFKEKILSDQDKWYTKCLRERSLEADVNPIRNFKIEGISINKNKAYLQVEIIRDTYFSQVELSTDGHTLPEGGYVVNYVMTKSHGKWFLDQMIQ